MRQPVIHRNLFVSTFAFCAILILAPHLSASPTNADFVQKAFQDLLLRPASPTDISTWSAQLDSNTITRTQFALDLMDTPEYLHTRASEFYNDFLNRSPSPTEASLLTIFLQSNTLPQGRASILGSAEYFSSQAGSTNAGFLSALYQDLLNRPIDPTASTFYQSQLTGGATRTDIALSVQNSDEWRTDIVTNYYQQFLHHAPDNSGLTFYKSLLSGGGTEQDVIASLIGSPEYFNNIPEPAVLALLSFALLIRRRR